MNKARSTKSPSSKKKVVNTRAKTTPATTSSDNSSSVEQASFWQRWKVKRGAKRLAKQKANKAAQKEAEALEATRQKTKEQAQKKAIRTTAINQVEQAVHSAKKRRSHPFAILFLLLIVIGLTGTIVWQYREKQIIAKDEEIQALKQEAETFAQDKQATEGAKQAEAARFKTIGVMGLTIRLPSIWDEKPSQFPLEEQVFGDENVTLRVINSEFRNSLNEYIPTLDYLWQLESTNNQSVIVKSQSLHCERFDTLDNDLSKLRREHQGFQAYCDTNTEKVIIAALATPGQYGIGPEGIYFMIEINDIQQITLNDIKDYLQSTKLGSQQ